MSGTWYGDNDSDHRFGSTISNIRFRHRAPAYWTTAMRAPNGLPGW